MSSPYRPLRTTVVAVVDDVTLRSVSVRRCHLVRAVRVRTRRFKCNTQSMPIRTVIERGPKGKRAVGLQPRMAGVEPRCEDPRGRPGDAGVVSGPISANRGPR